MDFSIASILLLDGLTNGAIYALLGMCIVLEKAVPIALKKAQPGTPEFRAALRDALENMGRTVLAHGVLDWTAQDHWGYTNETGVMLQVVNGQFKVIQ